MVGLRRRQVDYYWDIPARIWIVSIWCFIYIFFFIFFVWLFISLVNFKFWIRNWKVEMTFSWILRWNSLDLRIFLVGFKMSRYQYFNDPITQWTIFEKTLFLFSNFFFTTVLNLISSFTQVDWYLITFKLMICLKFWC